MSTTSANVSFLNVLLAQGEIGKRCAAARHRRPVRSPQSHGDAAGRIAGQADGDTIGPRRGEASKGEDATKIGAGAIGGAIIGGIVGGGDAAAKGAAIGGAAGTGVVLATRGKDVQLAAGTDLAATLAAPLTLRVAAGERD